MAHEKQQANWHLAMGKSPKKNRRKGSDSTKWSRAVVIAACLFVCALNVREYMRLVATLDDSKTAWQETRNSLQRTTENVALALNNTRREIVESSRLRSAGHKRKHGGEKKSESLDLATTSFILRRVEQTMRPPDDAKKVIIVGKSFIMERDAPIWDYTLPGAGLTTVHSTKKKIMRGDDSDFRAIKCLDLFDGKPNCFDPSLLLTFKRHQRVSRLFGLRNTLWSKDRFCETMSNSLRGFDVSMEFVFPCWMLPRDYPILINQARTKYTSRSFILKPTDRGEGNGIKIMNDWRQLPRWKEQFPDLEEVVVQTYLPNPFLINGFKWDMRTYVLVTSIHPLRAYMFRDGLVRFASTKYNPKGKDGALTNTSLNKKKGMSVEDLTWPFPKVYRWMQNNDGQPDLLWKRIEHAVSQMLLSAEPGFVKEFQNLKRGYTCANCYQLLGVDVIVDDELVPRVIEVNGEPSMQLSGQDGSQYDRTKKSMAHDLVALIYGTTDVSDRLAADFMELELEGLQIGFEDEEAGGCDNDIHDFCLSALDVEYFIELKREEYVMGGFRRIYPRKDGADLTDLIQHLRTRFPGDTKRGTFRIHELATELAKLCKLRFNNTIDDPNYVG